MKVITKDCSELWKEICFNRWRGSSRISAPSGVLTDEMLAALLIQVNACTVTTDLDLDGCLKIRGCGLEPLRHSRVLERVNLSGLRLINDTVYDIEREALGILRTSIPYKLDQVKFENVGEISRRSIRMDRRIVQTLRLSGYTVDLGWMNGVTLQRNSFIRDMRAEKKRQATEQCVACASCEEPVSELSRQITPDIKGVPSSRCSSCRKYFCRKSSCIVSMQDCCVCGEASCAQCEPQGRCRDCNSTFCSGCKYVSPPCDVCKSSLCEDCETVRPCKGCNKLLCMNCKVEEGDNNYYDDGEYLRPCTDCDAWYCDDCITNMSTCVTCNKRFCLDCRDLLTCDACGFVRCSMCAYSCVSCKKTLCDGCMSRKSKRKNVSFSKLLVCCTRCGDFNNQCYCGVCSSTVSPSLVNPSVSQGICSPCGAANESPSKRARQA